MIRCMLRRMDQLPGGFGMSAGCHEKCTWISAIDGLSSAACTPPVASKNAPCPPHQQDVASKCRKILAALRIVFHNTVVGPALVEGSPVLILPSMLSKLLDICRARFHSAMGRKPIGIFKRPQMLWTIARQATHGQESWLAQL